MTLWSQQEAYRSAAAAGATQIGLTVVAYDALAQHIHKASVAAAAGDITGRCLASNQALQIVGHLESWIPYLQDERLEASLAGFYAVLRESILQCQHADRQREFDRLAALVLEVRSSWQQKETALLGALQGAASDSVPLQGSATGGGLRQMWSA